MTVTSQKTPDHVAAKTNALCTEIPFELVSPSGSKLKKVPITSGVCLPKGALPEKGEWLVEFGGAHLPAQTEVLNRWSDGSVRWMLTRFVAGRIAPGRTACTLIRPEKRAQHFAGTTSLRPDGDSLILNISDPHNATDENLQIKPILIGNNGQPLELAFNDIENHSTGEVCCEFVVSANVKNVSNVSLKLRIEVWPHSGLIRTDTQIRNSGRAEHKGGLWDLGDNGSFVFGGLHIELGTRIQSGQIQWRTETTNQIRQCESDKAVAIVQHGSGAASWANTNHVDENNQSTVACRGYRAVASSGNLRGYRSEPCINISDAETRLAVAIPEFWQQFPAGLSSNNGTVTVGLFPEAEGPYELQGGEQKNKTACMAIAAATDEFVGLDWVYQQPRMIQSAEWVRRCNTIQWLPATIQFEDSAHSRFQKYLTEATTGNFSTTARRNKIDEYGWRNFGDVPADHEQTNYAGSNTVISHYNNQFDLIFGGIQNMLLTGDAQWFDMFGPLARHVIDIDIYHTNEDRSCFNGGLFWHTDHYYDAKTSTHRTYSRLNGSGEDGYGGGPSNEHNYTTGLMYYHFLTGDTNAREAVITLADWVIGMDDGSCTIFSLFDNGPTGLASQTKFEDFHGPGRGVGNSINALLDAWILTGNAQYINKLEQLIHRSCHPNQDCEELQLGDSENRWSYSVCMTALGRYLSEKAEAGQLDANYDYVRRTLENYGRWMADNEKPTLSDPDSLEFITEAWAAQDLRKANALRIAASCTDDAALESKMRNKADELNDAAWKDLYSFGQQHLTARCFSIVMTEGLRDVFHRTCRPEYMPPATASCSTSDWQMFVPQKARVKSMLKNPVKAVFAARSLLNPRRIMATVEALRRQF